MRITLMRLLLAFFVLIFTSVSISAQNCFSTGLNGTVINLPCNENCVNIPVKIPHIKSSSTYLITTIPYNPFPYVTAGGIEDPDLYDDDQFSNLVSLPFSFCFFDSLYSKAVVGSNGLITFDEARAAQLNAYPITQPIPYAGGTPNTISPAYYPRASIMGAYSDLDPRPGPTDPVVASPPDRKIEWRLEGSSPCRRFVVSFYKIGVFNNSACGLATPTTFQIVIYESTGIIEVYIENKQCHPSTGSNAILGVQNWARNIGIAAPGKNATVWTASNEAYRFVPSGGASRFVRSEVFALGGTTPLAVGDTATTTPGELDVTFPSFCPAGSGGQYVVRTTFAACDDPSIEIVSNDTITVNKTTSLNAGLSITPTSCGATGSGTATVTIPAGVGVAPYTFDLTPGSASLTGNSPQTFTGLNAGTYTINVTDATGGCSDDTTFTIVSTGTLAVTYNVTHVTCLGANNGQIIVNPPNGTPPITYSINGGPFLPNNIYNNLAAGTYTISTQDGAGCVKLNDQVTINPGPPLTMTSTTTTTSCPGASNGSITLTPTGTAPFQFSINGGPFLTYPGNTISNLAAGSYFIDVRDVNGCQSTVFAHSATVTNGTGNVSGTATPTHTSCAGANNGSITVNATGSGPFEYSINGGPYQTSATFTGLAPGTYTIRIRAGGVCISNPISVTINAGAGVTANTTATGTSCTGVNNGSVVVTPTNGAGPYTFVLDGTVTQTGATNTTFTGLTSGAHTVTITDNNGCVTTAPIPVNISAGAGFTATYTAINSSCAGATNGSITVTPGTGGTGPFTFVLDGSVTQTGATNTTFSGVASGTHSILITDANGCQYTLSNATVAASGGFTATFTSTNATCAGATNGTLTVTPGAGGTGPYTFTLGTVTQTGATNTTFTNLTSGPHTVQITDANGCQFTLNATVNASSGFTATYTSTNASCAGATNGSITVTPGTGGTGPYTFVLGTITQTGAASTTFNNLTSGPHSVLITDANGCQFTLNATVNASSGFTATYTSVNTSCLGASNGSITATPGTGGTGPYTFLLGTVTQTGASNTTFTGLAAGNHSIQITDANGCQFTLSNATVNAGPALAATVTPVATACPGVNNGSIVVTPTNGSGPYTFVLDGTTTQTGATTTTFTGVAAGSHTVTVTDVNGCASTLPPVTVATGSGITATVTPTGTSCTGATNGSILITPSNGTSPYTFVLNGTTTQTGASNSTFTGLASGSSYSITITDAIGCTGSFSNINVPQGSALLANAVPTPTTCNGAANGQIVVTPTNGGGPYTFVLNGTTTQTGATSTTFTGLPSSTYSIVVTDAAGCVSSAISSTVNPGPAITVSLTKTDADCFGASTGDIVAAASANASAPVQYSLDNVTWQTSPNFSGLPAGSYTVYVRDNVNCNNSATITIGQPTQLAVTTSIQNVKCRGQADGIITVNATGGTPPYSYSLDDITYQSGNSFTVGAASYTIFVRDANSCTRTPLAITVTEPAALAATATSANASCDGGNDGRINITVTGGTTPYQYSLDGATYQPTSVFNVAPGNYAGITVRDANGCNVTVPPVTVGLTNNLTLTPAMDPAPICEGDAIQLRLTTNATQFAWTPAGSLNNSTVIDPIAKPATSTLYSVVATLGRCTINDDIYVTVNAAPIPDAGPPGDICFGQSYVLQPVGDPGFTYTWTPNSTLSAGVSYNPVATPDRTTVYTLSVTDNNGCTSLITDQVTVNVTPPIQVTTYPVDTVVSAGATVPLLAVSAGTFYSWSPAPGLNNSNIANPIATAPVIEGSVTTYTVTATTTAGCDGYGYVTIRVYKGPELYVPTGFTPNGDNNNDRFMPFPVGIKKLNYFHVFNRWGQRLFTTTSLNVGWDGRFGGIEQPSGVYVWMAEGVTMDNQVITKKGTVTLIR